MRNVCLYVQTLDECWRCVAVRENRRGREKEGGGKAKDEIDFAVSFVRAPQY